MLYQDIWKLVDLSPVSIGHAINHSQWNFSFEGHPFHRLYFVEKGRFSLKYADREIVLKGGDACLIPAFHSFSYVSLEPNNHYYYHFNSLFLEHLPRLKYPMVASGVEGDRVREIFQELVTPLHFDEQDDGTQQNHICSLMYLPRFNELSVEERLNFRCGLMKLLLPFVTCLEKEEDEEGVQAFSRFAKVLEFVDKNIQRDIAVSELVELSQMCQARFSALFRKTFGLPPKQYICAQKINRALLLLVETDMTVAQIARATGYKDEFFFCRIFKKYCGLSPTTWRQNFRNGLGDMRCGMRKIDR